MATGAIGATNATEYSNAPFTDDSIYVADTVYTPVGSLTVTIDTSGSTLYFISGTIELGNYAWVHLAFCRDTTSGGVPQLIVSTDSTLVSLHEYYWRENIGDSPMRIPFSFTQNMTADTTGALKLYLMSKAGDRIYPAILHDVRIEAITNLANQP